MIFEVWPGRLVVLPEGETRCILGKGGVKPAADKREGDGATPAVSWRRPNRRQGDAAGRVLQICRAARRGSV